MASQKHFFKRLFARIVRFSTLCIAYTIILLALLLFSAFAIAKSPSLSNYLGNKILPIIAPDLHYKNADIRFIDDHLNITLHQWQYQKKSLSFKGSALLANFDPIALGHHSPWFQLNKLAINKLDIFLPPVKKKFIKAPKAYPHIAYILKKLSFANTLVVDNISLFAPDRKLLYQGHFDLYQTPLQRQLDILFTNEQSDSQTLKISAKNTKHHGLWQGSIHPSINIGDQDQVLVAYLKPLGLDALKSFSLDGALSLVNHQFNSVDLRYQLQDLKFTVAQHLRHYALLKQRIIGRKQRGNWQLKGLDSQDDSLKTTTWFSLFSQNNVLKLDIKSIDLIYLKWLEKYLPKQTIAGLRLKDITSKVSGRMQNFTMRAKQSPFVWQQLAMDISPINFALPHHQKLSLVDAKFAATPSNGSLTLQRGLYLKKAHHQILIPLKGTLKGTKKGGVWNIQSQNLTLLGNYFALPIDLTISDINHEPKLDLKASGKLMHVEKIVSALVPFASKDSAIGAASKAVVSWPSVQLEAHYNGRGNIDALYKGFKLKIFGNDLSWRPNEAYGVFDHLQSNMRFDQDTLTINAKSSDLNQNALTIKNLQAKISDLHQNDAHLLLQADLYSKNIQNAIGYIRHSPLNAQTGAVFDWLVFSGPFYGTIHLDAPLEKWQQSAAYKSTVTFKNNTMALTSNPHIKVRQLQGVLHLESQQISLPSLTGQLEHRPFKMSISTQDDKDFTHHVVIESYFNSAWLNPKSHQDLFQGVAPFMVEMHINDQHKTFTFNSDLKPVAIHAVAPFIKASGQSTPLQLSGDFSQKDQFLLDLQYNKVLEAKWNLEGSSWDQSQFKRGALYYQQTVPVVMPKEGFKLRAKLKNFSQQAWHNFFNTAKQSKKLSILNPPWPVDARLETGIFEVGGQTFHDALLDYSYSNHKGLFNIASSDSNGELSWLNLKNQKAQISAHFKDMHLIKPKSSKLPDISYSDTMQYFDLLRFTIDKLYLSGHLLGKFSGLGLNEDNTLHFAPLSLANKNYDLEAYLDTHFQTKPSQSTLKIRINFDHGDSLLDALFEQSFIKDVNGQLNANLTWNGGIKDFKNNHLSGKVMLVLQDGDLLFIQSKWLNFLGMVNLSNLFSNKDAGNGLPFDHFGAEYTLNNAVAKIVKLDLIGPIANLKGQGFVDFQNQHIDQQLLVMPHVSKGASVAAGLLGGPIAGAATYVGGLILRNTVLKDKGILYRIYGDLQNPKVHRVE